MSHASILVALSPEDIKEADNDIEKAIGHQMAPFNEGGEWFADGSRWDWWQIGGRFSGRFATPDYEPSQDPRNQESCRLCDGTGKRDDMLGAEARKHDPNYTCNGCGGKGISTKWPTDWVDHGNVAKRGDLDETKLIEARKVKYAAMYDEWLVEAGPPNGYRRLGYGVNEGESKEDYVARKASAPLTCSAFLRNRQWHEGGRMGWFGTTIKTECEIKAATAGAEWTGRCIHHHEESGAKIFDWTGPKDDDEKWDALFWARFVRNLPPDTTLVVVDFHV